MGLLEGKRVLITGAARGIGLAAARAMHDQGARLMMTDIDGGPLEDSAMALSNTGGNILSQVLDVANDEAISKVSDRLADEWGALDVLVNNAALVDECPIQDIDAARWRRMMDVNLTSVLRVTQAALPLLRKGSNANVINTISTQSFFAQPNSAAYGAAKGGLMSLTRCMAIDLGAEEIRVNAVAPGFIDTRMAIMADGRHEHEQALFQDFYVGEGKIPLRRAGTPEDCAGAFVFLASDLSRYITGQPILVDGGLSATY